MVLVDIEKEHETKVDYDQLFANVKSDNYNATFQELCYSFILYLKHQIEKVKELQDENFLTEMLDENMEDKVLAIEDEIDDINFYFRFHAVDTIQQNNPRFGG